MSEIDALPINLIKLSFSDTLPLVYINSQILGTRGKGWGGGAYVLPFFGRVYKIQPFYFQLYRYSGLLLIVLQLFCLFYFVILVIVCHKYLHVYPHPAPHRLLCDHDTESNAIKSYFH